VRHRERIRSKVPHILNAWQRYADALRPRKPCDVKCIRIPPPDEAALPNERGVCYAGFVLQAASGSCAEGKKEKALLLQLMRMGVPYLYWLHGLPPAGDLAQIEPHLEACLKDLTTLIPFPSAFTIQRIGGNPLARRASLLWDDPQFNPFAVPREV
jgi:hypothetical protein